MRSFEPLKIRQRLSRSYGQKWTVPVEFGPDGWILRLDDRSVIVSCAEHDGAEWVHASMARPDELPTYNELKWLHAAVFGAGYAYQVFPPPSDHVNIHEYALHLWGRHDGSAVLPEFGAGGSI